MVAFRRNQVTKRVATSKNLKPTKLWTSNTWQGSKTVVRESSPKYFPPFRSYGLCDFVNFKKKSSRFLLISPLHKFHYFPEKKLKNDAKTINNILPSLYWCHCAYVIQFYIFFSLTTIKIYFHVVILRWSLKHPIQIVINNWICCCLQN